MLERIAAPDRAQAGKAHDVSHHQPGGMQMSNVIGFLETLGSRPALSPADYANAVALLDADGAQREALLDRNATGLGNLLGGQPRMWCAVFAPDEQPDVEQPAREEPTPEDPDREEPLPDDTSAS